MKRSDWFVGVNAFACVVCGGRSMHVCGLWGSSAFCVSLVHAFVRFVFLSQDMTSPQLHVDQAGVFFFLRQTDSSRLKQAQV